MELVQEQHVKITFAGCLEAKRDSGLLLLGTREFSTGKEKQEFDQYEMGIEMAKRKKSGWIFNLTTVMDSKYCKYYLEFTPGPIELKAVAKKL